MIIVRLPLAEILLRFRFSSFLAIISNQLYSNKLFSTSGINYETIFCITFIDCEKAPSSVQNSGTALQCSEDNDRSHDYASMQGYNTLFVHNTLLYTLHTYSYIQS